MAISGGRWIWASSLMCSCIRTMLVLFLLCLGAGLAAAQNLNPAYLKEMPPVDRVMNDMKTGDPAETAARQMGALLQMKTMIEDAAGPRFFSRTNGLTADETRLRQQYYTAEWQLSQSKPELKGLNALRGYDVDPKFREELFKRYFSASFRAQVLGANAPALARAAARDKANAAAAQAMMASSATPARPASTASSAPGGGSAASTSAGPSAPAQSSTAAAPVISALMGNQPGCAGSVIASAFCVQAYEYLATNNLAGNADALAQGNFANATQNDPNIADAYAGLGLLSFNHMFYDKAAQRFKQYVALRPQDAEGFLELGLTYYDLRQYGPAAEALRKAIALKLTDANDLQIATHKLELAASGKAPAGPPAGDKAMAYVNQASQLWGSVHDSQDDVYTVATQVAADYKAAIAINPKLEDAYLGMGVASWEYQANNLPNASATNALQQATRLAPDDRRAWCQLGLAYFNAGDFANAATALQQADRLRANDVCLLDLGNSYVGLGKKADALNVYKKLQGRNKELAAMVYGAINQAQ